MSYLETEDDGYGPVPMEVGAMKGKKGDRGKKGCGQGKYGNIFGKVRQKQRVQQEQRVRQRQ